MFDYDRKSPKIFQIDIDFGQVSRSESLVTLFSKEDYNSALERVFGPQNFNPGQWAEQLKNDPNWLFLDGLHSQNATYEL